MFPDLFNDSYRIVQTLIPSKSFLPGGFFSWVIRKSHGRSTPTDQSYDVDDGIGSYYEEGVVVVEEKY